MKRQSAYGIKLSSDELLKRLIAAQALEHKSDKPTIDQVLKEISSPKE